MACVLQKSLRVALQCNDKCRGSLHATMHDSRLSFVCDGCNSGYECEVLCMSKEQDEDVGVYLVTMRRPTRDGFEDCCDDCPLRKARGFVWSDDAAHGKIDGAKCWQRTIREIGAIRLPHWREPLPTVTFRSDDGSYGRWNVTQRDTTLMSWTLTGSEGVVSFE